MSKPKLLKIFDSSADEKLYSKLNNPVTVTLSGTTLVVSETLDVEMDSMITFEAPCDCAGITGISINDVTYTLVDSMDNPISTVGNVYCSGAKLSVVLDTADSKAYLLNPSKTQALNDLDAAKAPTYSPIQEVTASTTISAPSTGKVVVAHASSALTITLPSLTSTDITELEILNYGTADVTISGTIHTDWSTSVSSVVVEASNAVALKWVGSFWTIIGNYT